MKFSVYSLIGAALLVCHPVSAQVIELADFPSADGVRFLGNNPNSVPSQTCMPAGDFNGDGYDDLLFGSPLQNPDSGAYIAFGKPDLTADVNLQSVVNSASSVGLRMFDSEQFIAFEVSPAGDFNNDGYDDVLLLGGGSAYLVYGHPAPHSNINLTQPSSRVVKFLSGRAGGGIGDFNNDGFDDIVLSDDTYAPVYYLPNSGRTWVIFGRENLFGDVSLSNFQTSNENGFTITGRNNTKFGGSIYPIGDFNGDGYSDFAVARSMGLPTDRGYTRLVFLGKGQGLRAIDFNEEPDKSNLPADCIGIGSSAFNTNNTYAVGSATGIPMDFNGDGMSDLLIGNMSNYSTGRTTSFVVFGRNDGADSIDLSDIAAESTQGLQLVSPAGQDFGVGYTWGGDLNNDGFADVVLTENNLSLNDIANAGCAYVIWGENSISGMFDLTDFEESHDGFIVNGEMPNPQPFVFSTSPGGDVNGDGYDDFLLAVTGYQASNSYGYNYLVRGRQSSTGVGDWILY